MDERKYFEKYFDAKESDGRKDFGEDSDYFDPRDECFQIDEIEKISDSKVRIHFSHSGGRGRTRKTSGIVLKRNRRTRSDGTVVVPSKEIAGDGDSHLYMMVEFVGSILCEEIVSFKEEKADGNKTKFSIGKKYWSGNKIVEIENESLGKIRIECKKLYAEKFECYDSNGKKWKWEDEA